MRSDRDPIGTLGSGEPVLVGGGVDVKESMFALLPRRLKQVHSNRDSTISFTLGIGARTYQLGARLEYGFGGPYFEINTCQIAG